MRYLPLFLVACSPMIYNPVYPGVPNIDLVDAGVYRSGQIPDDAGWDTISRLAAGRKVHVVKLNFDNEGQDHGALARGWDVVYLPIQPEGDQDIWDEAKGLAAQPDPTRVSAAIGQLQYCHQHVTTDLCLVHCTHGQDRTGLVVGEYRVREDKWNKEQAWHEMLAHNFHWEIYGLMEAWEDFQ